jgi:hypothetical protein
MNQTVQQLREQRLAPRRNTIIPATIVFDGGRRRLQCIIRNISDGGVKLEVFAVSQIPATFDLLHGTQLVPCRVVWRALKEIGVAFRRD